TSGEVEFALLFGPGGPWVTVASDQTDRFSERHSVPAAKQLCPKVLGAPVWPLAEVEGHWDELVLRAWVRRGPTRRLYQQPTLDGERVYGDGYELELADPRLDRRIRTEYTVEVLEPPR